jgi:nucleotide-binding universal stress UspA family protein
MFTTVVVPLDGTAHAEAAVPLAVDLATAGGAELLLFSVADLAGLDERERYLEKLVADLTVPCRFTVTWLDRPGGGISEAARQCDPALVVMATHGHRPIGAAVLGSVGTDVVRRAGTPVVMVGPRYAHRDGALTDIFVALDGSEYASAAIPAATDLATFLGVGVTLLEVVNPRSRDEMAEAPEQLVESNDLVWAAESVVGPPCSWEVLHDNDPARGLADYIAAQPGVPLLVLATHGRTGRALVTAGSVATKLLHEATFPVMMLRPADLGG